MDLEIYRLHLANNVSVTELKRLMNDIVMTLDLVAEQYKFNSYDQRDLVELKRVLLDLIFQAELSLFKPLVNATKRSSLEMSDTHEDNGYFYNHTN